MPRRRMIDPLFYTDRKVGKLTRDERAFILGCISQSDDDGRLQADPAFLKSSIFMYDDDFSASDVIEIRDSCLDKMKAWPTNHPYLLVSYSNSGEEYLYFPNFNITNKPSHPSISQLPQPPREDSAKPSGEPREDSAKPSGEPPPQVRVGRGGVGQVRSGQDRLGKGRALRENLEGISEDDLTDRLTDMVTENMSAAGGRTKAMAAISELFRDGQKKLGETAFQVLYEALGKYNAQTIGRTLAKVMKYGEGNHNPAKYIKKILDEQTARPP